MFDINHRVNELKRMDEYVKDLDDMSFYQWSKCYIPLNATLDTLMKIASNTMAYLATRAEFLKIYTAHES